MAPPPPGPRGAAALAAAALGDTRLPLLVVRRSRRMTGLNLFAGSLGFGLAVASVWYAWEAGEPLLGPLFLLFLITVYGVQAGQQFRDDGPKLVVERAGLTMPGVIEGAIPWSSVEEIATTTGLRALVGGKVDVVVDLETYARMRLGTRWMGDPIVKAGGSRPAFRIIGNALDTDAKTIFAAMRRYWPPGG
ncbi:MAG: hypothetical protein HY059_12075 [Proteobacteria bacterium]|nr:hypothetical protein [Pseudomonadota bacterium]